MPSSKLRIVHSNDAVSVQAGIEEARAFGSHRARPATPVQPSNAPARRKPLGQLLVEMGALSPENLAMAVALMAREDARFGDILLSNGWIRKPDLYAALALQYNCDIADLATQHPDVRLIDQIGAEFCIQNGIVPWKRAGAATIVICARPDQFESLSKSFPATWGECYLAIAPEEDIHSALINLRHRSLAQRAESRVAEEDSCRNWRQAAVMRYGLAVIAALSAVFIVSSFAGFAVLVGWAVLTLILNSSLKAIAAWQFWRRKHDPEATFVTARSTQGFLKLPTVSILVPLYKEREIAGRLVKRLERLSYPRELLDICLVVEEDDALTQQTLAHSDLPRWMRQIVVPRGMVKTKPRAMNFALDFCKGSIIGVYDAEDAPDPDQIHKVVRRFSERGPDVACLQGKLDFYNARTNWLSRCFTVEYATWWGLVLPGVERMGFAIPLGGTTLFFRRAALEQLGGWDAHNVTEDADLGIRLARRGYRTELIDTVTEEEANCRVWPWIKQRSRWIKGYAMTYGVHMRNPRQLRKELGWWKFAGFQILFLGALSQFLLAPILWTFWAFPLGLPHPLRGVAPHNLLVVLGTVFMAAELLTITVGVQAVSNTKHRWLRYWVPTLHFYYPLASLAAMKGFFEIMTKPFYWDKTQHGKFDQQPATKPPEVEITLTATNPA
ncbi:Glycosyltransferase, catalytic subunit of cellulose synthase and poly-beta-1,6-N-acetylglucosamine synthase [Aliiroseovarius halocynthiae]|uniref:Glycosyltransferase n=1 Tax=Aliiroseovarius halocynthiae TaxID=985055 RepID=A0A545SRB7_9RHOB|nr:glycosyltransferase family 2 protein [Aliiroseovarius halocynthiae]TQV67499.1 glycosyltransferase [Aliiroseovarius halocynthiae]SMR81509.1 Glycosyltransferase, catalytic subunit of cellulose synthase and poly-beta-1,6-N-acetylglucosamine synthase [Aliiroseovarius halocynthiae]